MAHPIITEPLSKTAFRAFGDVIEASGEPDQIINQGLCGRYHNRAELDFIGGVAGVSLFQAEPRQLPLRLEMMERHPNGSQTFIPMSMDAFLIIAAHDAGGKPDIPRAFQSTAGQAINFHRNIWHGVLTPLAPPGLFAVVDRIGAGPNLEEYWFKTPYVIAQSTAQAL